MQKRGHLFDTENIDTAISFDESELKTKKYRLSNGQFLFPATHTSVAFNSKTGAKVFLKVTRSNTAVLEEEILSEAKREKDAAFIVELISTFLLEDVGRLFMLKNCYYGSLNTVLSQRASLPMHLAHFVKIAFSLATALDFLHSKELSHGFITIKHCVVDEFGYVRLCGLSNVLKGSKASRYRWIDNAETGYFAPEIMDTKKSEYIDPFLVDMFACGVIFYLCLTGCFPHWAATSEKKTAFSGGQSPHDSVQSIIFPPVEKFRRRNMPPAVPPRIVNLRRNSTNNNSGLDKPQSFFVEEALKTAQRLLNSKPEVRLRAGALLCSPWLQKAIQQQEQKNCSLNAFL